MTGRRPKRLVRLAFRLPRVLFDIRLGWIFAGRLILVEHVGRKSGTRYRTALEVVDRDRSGVVIVASGFGGRSDWYRNLVAEPKAHIIAGRRAIAVDAEPMSVSEGSAVMLAYGRRHRWIAQGVLALTGIHVDGSDEGFVEAGQELRFMRLRPR
jgi:deazaflavin-dependent oxidoreductase (nitroreductase family)